MNTSEPNGLRVRSSVKGGGTVLQHRSQRPADGPDPDAEAEVASTAESNKATVRRVFDEIASEGRFEIIPEIYSPDVVDHDPLPGAPGGLGSVHQSMGGLRGAFPDMTVVVEDISAHGDYVVVHNTWTGTHSGPLLGIPPTGRHVSFGGIVLFRLEDGLIAERWGLLDTSGLMRQIGQRVPVRSPGKRSPIHKEGAGKRRVRRNVDRLIQVRRIRSERLVDWRTRLAELEGPRKVEVARSRRDLGVARELVWHAAVGGDDFSVCLWEHDDLAALRRALATDADPFLAEDREWWLAAGSDVSASAEWDVVAEKTFEWADVERLREVDSVVGVMFLHPVLPGQEEALADFRHQLSGPRHEEYVAARRGALVVRDAAYEQQVSQDLRVHVVYQEMTATEGLQTIAHSEDPFDVWYRERLLHQHGTDLSALRGLPSELVFEWPPPVLAGL